MSVNSLVNQVFSNYVDFYSSMPDAGIMPFSKSAIQKMAAEIPEKDLIRVARNVAESDVADIVLAMRGDYTLESFRWMFKIWCTLSGFAYREKEEEGNVVCIVQHNMGKPFSLFLEQTLATILGKKAKGKFELQLASNFVIATIHQQDSERENPRASTAG